MLVSFFAIEVMILPTLYRASAADIQPCEHVASELR